MKCLTCGQVHTGPDYTYQHDLKQIIGRLLYRISQAPDIEYCAFPIDGLDLLQMIEACEKQLNEEEVKTQTLLCAQFIRDNENEKAQSLKKQKEQGEE